METIKKHIPEIVRRFLYIIFLSLLPGVCLSLIMFINALFHDFQQQNYRDSLPDTDLSLVRIEDRIIDDSNPYICMGYPATYKFEWDEDSGKETWYNLTVDGVPMPDYETALETLSGTHSWIQGTRPLEPYSVFLDRSNNIELRFSYDLYGEVDGVSMMRIDNRSTFAFLTQRKLLPYDSIGLPFGAGADSAYGDAVTDYGHSYGPKLFSHWEPEGIMSNIFDVLRTNRFLFYLREYFYIPLYGAAWLYPLFLAISKRRLRWILPLIVWYPIWYVFCLFTYLAQQ